MTTIIKQDDLITSVKDALQFISYYHPQDFIQAMSRAYDREENKAAKDAIAQILINSRMCAEGHRPICQDTGIVNVFVEVGMDVKFDLTMSLDDAINEGVRQGYLENSNVLRASVLAYPAFGRKNTRQHPCCDLSQTCSRQQSGYYRCGKRWRFRKTNLNWLMFKPI